MTEPEEEDRYARAIWLRRPDEGRPRRRQPPSPPDAPTPPSEFEGVLVSSADGEIARLGLALNRHLFVQPAIPEDADLLDLSLQVFTRILETVPKTAEVIAVSERKTKAAAFLESARFQLSNRVVDANGIDHTVWLQDPFCTVLVEDVPRFVKPSWSDGDQDPKMVDRLESDLGIPCFTANDVFEGGNVLAGTKHWFLGADEARNITTTGDVAAVEAAYREIGGGRKLVLVRSAIEVPNEQSLDRVSADPGPPKDVFHARNWDTQQPIFHIDMFMTIALDADGREVVLIASPREAAKLMPEEALWPAAAALDAQLDSVEEVIRAQAPELEIIRLPTPLFAVDTLTRRRWRYAGYANALLQRDAAGRRTVWLPQFEGKDTKFPWTAVHAVDAKVREIYEKLGYEVVALPDCRAFSYHFGGPHCAFHYLARS